MRPPQESKPGRAERKKTECTEDKHFLSILNSVREKNTQEPHHIINVQVTVF